MRGSCSARISRRRRLWKARILLEGVQLFGSQQGMREGGLTPIKHCLWFPFRELIGHQHEIAQNASCRRKGGRPFSRATGGSVLKWTLQSLGFRCQAKSEAKSEGLTWTSGAQGVSVAQGPGVMRRALPVSGSAWGAKTLQLAPPASVEVRTSCRDG